MSFSSAECLVATSLPEHLDGGQSQKPSSPYIRLVFAGPVDKTEYYYHHLLPSCFSESSN